MSHKLIIGNRSLAATERILMVACHPCSFKVFMFCRPFGSSTGEPASCCVRDLSEQLSRTFSHHLWNTAELSTGTAATNT